MLECCSLEIIRRVSKVTAYSGWGEILVVDDEEVIRNVAQRILQDSGPFKTEDSPTLASHACDYLRWLFVGGYI